MPELRQGETGETGLSGRLSLHQTLCLLRRPALPGASIRDVAAELTSTGRLSRRWRCSTCGSSSAGWHAGTEAIGIDEISIRKGHDYRIVVSDLVRKRPIWFGGAGRSEAGMDGFFAWLGPAKSSKIRLAVMDMWKPFRNVARANAPQAAILFDKFHVLRHLGEAMDKVRKAEYGRLSGKDRHFIKGQKYTLLSRRENLSWRAALAQDLARRQQAAQHRLPPQGIVRPALGLRARGWARRFFDNWRASLKWQRLGPYEKFAAMIERHWDGIAAYCHPENKVALGFVEGLNTKIRVIQRRAYGLRDEEYLRLKVLTCMLPPL